MNQCTPITSIECQGGRYKAFDYIQSKLTSPAELSILIDRLNNKNCDLKQINGYGCPDILLLIYENDLLNDLIEVE